MASFYAFYEELEWGPEQHLFIGPLYHLEEAMGMVPTVGDVLELRHREPERETLRVVIRTVESLGNSHFRFSTVPPQW
jgi:hypothetical protein